MLSVFIEGADGRSHTPALVPLGLSLSISSSSSGSGSSSSSGSGSGSGSQSRARGHTTKIILWGSHSSIVISRRHTGEATTNTTSQTSTLVGANLCLLIPKPKSLATATFHNAPFDSSKQRRPKELSMRAKHRERGGSPGAWRRGLATCQAFVSPQRGALPTLRMNRFS